MCTALISKCLCHDCTPRSCQTLQMGIQHIAKQCPIEKPAVEAAEDSLSQAPTIPSLGMHISDHKGGIYLDLYMLACRVE